ncbi:hypothetical protein CF327_g6563 [Tilletia walkeri]|nr:hypothetical protein CF327_g6563 [Tilletia walkeri]
MLYTHLQPPLIRSTALTLAGASAGVLGLRNFSGYVAISNESILFIATSFVSPCSSRRGSSIESQVVSSIRLSRSLAGLLVCLLRDLSAGVSIAQVFIEMLCTSALIFSVFMLVVEKHPPTYLAPIGIGLTLFTCHLFAVVWTGSGLNPARSFGPAVVSGVFPKEHWLYWIAPFCGGIFAVIYFEVLKALKFNSVVLDKEITDLRNVHVRVYRFICQDPNAEIPLLMYPQSIL